jgi:hypothetical protein
LTSFLKAIRGCYFDPWTLVESQVTGRSPRTFSTKAEARQYALTTGESIPVAFARGGGELLMDLLGILAYAPDVPAKADPTANDDPKAGQFIAGFFSLTPEFRYDPRAETWQQFYDMSRTLNWRAYPEHIKAQRTLLKDAAVREFNLIYGTDEKSIVGWEALCRAMGITPLPSTRDLCRHVCPTVTLYHFGQR